METLPAASSDDGTLTPIVDVAWLATNSSGHLPGSRAVRVHDVLRYAQRADQSSIEIDGYLNYHFLMSPRELGLPKVMLEAGINPTREIDGDGERRRPLIAIRSSPWKAGQESNPWHDEFDLDHGHVRYFGDHKPTTVGLPGATKGNRALLDCANAGSATPAVSFDDRASRRPGARQGSRGILRGSDHRASRLRRATGSRVRSELPQPRPGSGRPGRR